MFAFLSKNVAKLKFGLGNVTSGWYGMATGTVMASNLDTVPFDKKVPLVETELTDPCFVIWAYYKPNYPESLANMYNYVLGN